MNSILLCLQLQFRAAPPATTIIRAAGAPGGQSPPIKPGQLGVSSFPETNCKRGPGSAPIKLNALSPSLQSNGSATDNFPNSSSVDIWQVGLNIDEMVDGPSSTSSATAGQTGAAEAGTDLIISTTLTKRHGQEKRRDSLFKLGAALFCDILESALVNFERFQNNVKNQGRLGRNFAPVETEFGPSAPLHVTGTLPSCLNGEVIRVGPNSKFKPSGNSSWLDGDGMLHGLRIKDGEVSYTARYVRTARLAQEEHYGGAKFTKVGSFLGRIGLFWVLLETLRKSLGVLDVSNGSGTANTGLVFHNRKLLSLHESDKPYSIRVHDDGNLETTGVVSYDGKLNHPFTAHPKIDPVTGEMFLLGYNLLGKQPFVTYRVVSKGGEMREPVEILTSGFDPVMMHDMAITEHYAVFLDCPIYFKPMDTVLYGRDLFVFDDSKTTRFGILPRYAGNDSGIRWFDLPACMIFHTANAWEEGEEVVLIACRSQTFTFNTVDKLTNGIAVAREFWGDLYEFRFNLRTGEASQKALGDFVVEFPVINPSYQGRRNRYVYMAVMATVPFGIKGIAKFDLTKEPEPGKAELDPQSAQRTNLAGVFWFGEASGGSEAIFVPSGLGLEEDQGYLVCYAHDENEGISKAIVIDARTMRADPVAVIEFPARVPYGFHGLFVPEKQLMEQQDFLSITLEKV